MLLMPAPLETQLITTESLAIHWSGKTANFTFGTGTMDKANANDSSIESAGSTPVTFDGNFQIDFTLEAIPGGGRQTFGVFPISEDATFNESDNHSRGDLDLMTNSWYFYLLTGVYGWFHANTSQKTETSVANGDTYRLKRVGAVLTAYRDEVLSHTYTQESTAELRMCVGGSDTPMELEDVSWTV